MQRMLRGFAHALCASLALALGLVACGDDHKTESRAISAALTAFPDALDPALSYDPNAWQALWLVYTPLLTYAHTEGTAGTRLIPGLAQALPQISADGKTYRLKLRAGLKFSDGSAVKASDFEHTVKRILNLESDGASYFQPIVGASEYLEAGKSSEDISGIDTNDRTREITIRLTEPDGSFSNVLALTFGGIVPASTPFKNQTKTPPPGAGPFKLANVRLNRGFDLVKVPGFKVAGIPQAKLDHISTRVVKNRGRQTQSTIRNDLDYMIDAPAPDQISSVRDRFAGKRYKEFITNSAYYFFLNHRVAPFDKKAVRQAVNYALDQSALAKVYGGLFEPACNFLPPGMKGYEKVEPCPYGDPSAPSNLGRARHLIKQAGAEGQRVRVLGSSQPEPKGATEYLADVLTQIGLKAKPQIVSDDAYGGLIQSAKTKAQAGLIAYFPDYPRPSAFSVLIDGGSIQPTSNLNAGNIDDPQINKLLARADRDPDLDAVADDYAAADRRLLSEAHLAPYGQRKLSVFFSDRIDFEDCTVWHPVFNLDYASLCLK